MTDEREPLYCYCLAIGGREFAIQVTRDGVMRWDDYQERRRSTAEGRRSKTLPELLASGQPVSILASEADEFTVSFQLSAEHFARICEAASRFAADQWSASEEERLDEQLIPLFWRQVNPNLSHPISWDAAQGDTPR